MEGRLLAIYVEKKRVADELRATHQWRVAAIRRFIDETPASEWVYDSSNSRLTLPLPRHLRDMLDRATSFPRYANIGRRLGIDDHTEEIIYNAR